MARSARQVLLAAAITAIGALSSHALAQPQQLSEGDRLTQLAHADEPSCAYPWTYSRGLNRCICIREGFGVQWGKCLPMSSGVLPLASAAPQSSGPKDPAKRMEKIAEAQDCLASLGFYNGLVDGEAGNQTDFAFSRFADQYGLEDDDDLFSQQAQMALAGACSDETATLPDRPPLPPR